MAALATGAAAAAGAEDVASGLASVGVAARAIGAAILDAQRAVHHLEHRAGSAAHPVEPRLPCGSVGDAVGVAERVGHRSGPLGPRRSADQRHADLRAEAGAETQRVFDRVVAALGEIQGSELGIDLAEVGHRRNDTGFQRLDGHHVLDADTHRVAGESLRVGDDDAVGTGSEHLAQGVHLGRGAAAARGGVGFVRDEHGLRRHGVALDARARFSRRDEPFHHLADVLDIEAGAVEGAVRRDRAQHLADRPQAAFAHRVGALHHDGGGAHAEQHAVAPPIERQRRLLDHVVGGRGAGGQEAGADPLDQVVAGDVVGGDDDHPPAAPGADPVLGKGDRLRRAGAGGVDLRVGTAGADQLGELRMAHGEDAEQKPPIERVRLALERRAQRMDLLVEVAEHLFRSVALREAGAQVLQGDELLPPGVVGVIARDLVDESVVAGERGGEDDAGVVAQRVGEHPALGQERAFAGRAVAHHQRDAGVAQRVDAGGDGQPRARVQRRQPFGRDAELRAEVERGHRAPRA